MQHSLGYKDCLSAIDRYSRRPEDFPIANMEAETAAQTLYKVCVTGFGFP